MAKIIVNTKDLPHEEWLEHRKKGLGGSDAAAVAGVSKYASPLTLYMEKRGMYSREVGDFVKEAAEWGNIMESVLRDQFKRRINMERAEQGLKPLWVQQRHAIFAHDEFDFMRTNLDGQIMGHELGTGVLEIKTGSEYTKDEWDGEDVPNAYYLQVQHNIKVMEANYAYLVVLIGGNKYKHYFIERDEDTINSLVAIEHDFWHNHILQAIPPSVDGSDSTSEMMKILYPKSYDSDAPVLNLPNSLIEHVETVDTLKELIECLEEQKALHLNEIKATMGENAVAWAGPHKVTWRTASNGVRSMRITVDAENAKAEIKAKYQRAIDRKQKAIEKEREAKNKERLKAEKEAEKVKKAAQKEADKLAKAAAKIQKERYKAEQLSLKELQEIGLTIIDGDLTDKEGAEQND